MRQETRCNRVIWRLVLALTLAAFLCLVSASSASAQDLSESFEISYDPVTFDKDEINGSEVFHVQISGSFTCAVDLPVSVNEASLTSRVVATHTASNMTVTLNESYTITISPFPSKKGETAEIKQSVPLQFMAKAIPGDYNVVGKIIEAKVKVLFGWVEVTKYLPQEQQMGTVKYIAPEPEEVTETPPPPPPETTPVPAMTPAPAPAPVAAPATTPVVTETITPWWVWLVVAIAAVTTVINIVSWLRRRYG